MLSVLYVVTSFGLQNGNVPLSSCYYAKFCVHFLDSIVYVRYIFIPQEMQDSPLMVPL